MKRISTLAAAFLAAAMLSGCVVHPRGIDPLTGCRTGCSVEAVPGGPLDCCFWINALRCPVLPWNWGQILNCSSCEPYGCGFRSGCGIGRRGCGMYGGFGPAPIAGMPGGYVDPGFGYDYPPMLTGGDCCDSGIAAAPMMPGIPSFPGMPMHSAGGCESGNCGVPAMSGVPYESIEGHLMPEPSGIPGPSRTFVSPADPMLAPNPMPGALPGPMPNPALPMAPMAPMSPMTPMAPAPAPESSLPPATLMAPTTYVTPSSYMVPANVPTMRPRTSSPYVAAPQRFVAPANTYPLVAPH